MSNKAYLIIIAVMVIVLTLLAILVNMVRKNIDNAQESNINVTEEPSGPFNTPTLVPLPKVKGQSIDNVPTLPPSKGEGLDLDSPEIQKSMSEIEKLNEVLPYTVTFTSSRGINVDIHIPALEIQPTEWMLTVYITGIDYEVGETSVLYDDMKASFTEAAVTVYNFLNQHEVNTENIIIEWGDREFMQQKAQEWLLE